MSKEAKMVSAFLQALAQGRAQVIEVEIDPNLPIDKQIEAQLEAHLKDAEARHRETCPDCAAAHAKEQAQAKTEVQAKMEAQAQAKMEAQAQAQSEAETKTKPIDPVRKPVKFSHIGYMAFDGDKPIDKTFDADRDTVKQGIQQFLDDPMAKLMHSITGGRGFPKLSVKPVFTRDDL